MTLIAGILCSDGVVVASDSFATYAEGAMPTIGQQQVTKVRKLGNSVIYASTGAIGVAQIIATLLGRMEAANSFAGPAIVNDPTPSTVAMTMISFQIAEQVRPIIQSAAAMASLVGAQAAGATAVVKSIVAVAVAGRPCLFQFDSSGAPEEATSELPFIALGSGQAIADPFLALLKRILWTNRAPTVAEGRFVAAWTITHVSKTNFGGVGLPPQIASLTIQNGNPVVAFADAGEHEQAVTAAEAALREHLEKQARPVVAAADAPAPPEPPAP